MTKSQIDWPAIEKIYSETRTSVAALGKEYGLCHATVANHMRKNGITRNPAVALTVSMAERAAPPVIENATEAELEKLRNAVIAGHRDDIQINRKRLRVISERLDAMTGLSNMQRLNALKVIVQIEESIIKLERQVHNIFEEAPPAPPPVAVQVNIGLDPQDAYLRLIGRK